MSSPIQNYILAKLQQRKDENNFRSLSVTNGLVDFYSNDYLGFARDARLKQLVIDELETHKEFYVGSTGSRLLSGNNEYVQALEDMLAGIHNAESALIFNSGFDANYGLISTLPYTGDTIIYDEFVHASIHDGIRAGKADAVCFRHNDLNELEEKLKSAKGLKYVIVESVYSMDGDLAPLKEIADLCVLHNAGLIVDEAHATGIFGKKGQGRVVELDLEDKCLARVYTFSKALGAFGAAVLCSSDLKAFLTNYCRPFIFSTALSFPSLAAIKCSYQLLLDAGERRNHLFALADYFRKHFIEKESRHLTSGKSAIQSIVVVGNQQAKDFSDRIRKNGFDVRAILYPTVPKGRERIRICLHSFNTLDEVSRLVEIINE